VGRSLRFALLRRRIPGFLFLHPNITLAGFFIALFGRDFKPVSLVSADLEVCSFSKQFDCVIVCHHSNEKMAVLQSSSYVDVVVS